MRYLFHAFLFALVLAGSLHVTESHMIFQTSTLQALMDGVYDGNMTFQELGRYGDFGIGTFNGLDGEMIGLDGKFYQIKADGRVSPVAGTMKTPLAEVTLFKAGKTYTVEKSFYYDQL
jgi:acetolactate decarboxylase